MEREELERAVMSAATGIGRVDGGGGRRRKRRELTDEQKQEISEAFALFDSDKDQALDYHELKVCGQPQQPLDLAHCSRSLPGRSRSGLWGSTSTKPTCRR